MPQPKDQKAPRRTQVLVFALAAVLLSACREDKPPELSEAERAALAQPSVQQQALLAQALPVLADLFQTTEAELAASGRALDAADIERARSLGVKLPELVRVAVRERFPQPADHRILQAAQQHGLDFGSDKERARTQGYAILLKPEVADSKAQLARELVRVSQYERAISSEDFLRRYLAELLAVGPGRAPLDQEIDQRIREAGELYRKLLMP